MDTGHCSKFAPSCFREPVYKIEGRTLLLHTARCPSTFQHPGLRALAALGKCLPISLPACAPGRSQPVVVLQRPGRAAPGARNRHPHRSSRRQLWRWRHLQRAEPPILQPPAPPAAAAVSSASGCCSVRPGERPGAEQRHVQLGSPGAGDGLTGGRGGAESVFRGGQGWPGGCTTRACGPGRCSGERRR